MGYTDRHIWSIRTATALTRILVTVYLNKLIHFHRPPVHALVCISSQPSDLIAMIALDMPAPALGTAVALHAGDVVAVSLPAVAAEPARCGGQVVASVFGGGRGAVALAGRGFGIVFNGVSGGGASSVVCLRSALLVGDDRFGIFSLDGRG